MGEPTITFPRTHNGHTDTGKHSRSGPRHVGSRKCPNCRSFRYFQTVSTEQCPECGLLCDYWVHGPNAIYREMMEAKWAQERADEAYAADVDLDHR